MKVLDSGALRGLTKLLGIAGGATDTEFDEAILQQVLDVAPYLRRTRASAGTTGIFTTSIQNQHTDAGAASTVVADLNPYTAAPAALSTVWPRDSDGSVRDIFDIWLLGVGAAIDAGAGNLDGATLTLQLPTAFNVQLATTQTLGTSVATAGALGVHYAYYSEVLATAEDDIGGADTLVNRGFEGRNPLPCRIPRGGLLRWISRTLAGGADNKYIVKLVLGVFPAGFGQDFAL